MNTQTRSLIATTLFAIPVGLIAFAIFAEDTANVRVWVDQPGAEVWVDETRVEPTPATHEFGPIDVPAGSRRIEVRRGGELLYSQNELLEPGESRVIRPKLRSTTAASFEPQTPVLERPTGQSLPGHEDTITGLGFLEESGRALSMGHDQMFRLWNIEQGTAERSVTIHEGRFEGMTVFDGGRRVLAIDDALRLSIRDGATGDLIRSFEVASLGVIRSATVTPDGSLIAAGGSSGEVRVIREADNAVLATRRSLRATVGSLAFSPDGRTLLIGQNGTVNTPDVIEVLDIASGKITQSLIGHEGPITGVAFRPDGRHVVSTSHDGTLQVWDVATGKSIRRLSHNGASALCLTLSQDGRFAVVGTGHHWDRYEGWLPTTKYAAHLWDLHTSSLVGRFATSGPVRCVALSPNGRHVLAGGEDAVIHVWNLPPRDVLVGLVETHASLAQRSPDASKEIVKKHLDKGFGQPAPKGA